MPFVMVNEQAQIVPEVKAEIDVVGQEADLRRYLDQPIRLRGLVIYDGSFNAPSWAQDFDKRLTQLGVDHQYLEGPAGLCELDWSPVFKFVPDRLAE